MANRYYEVRSTDGLEDVLDNEEHANTLAAELREVGARDVRVVAGEGDTLSLLAAWPVSEREGLARPYRAILGHVVGPNLLISRAHVAELINATNGSTGLKELAELLGDAHHQGAMAILRELHGTVREMTRIVLAGEDAKLCSSRRLGCTCIMCEHHTSARTHGAELAPVGVSPVLDEQEREDLLRKISNGVTRHLTALAKQAREARV